MGPEFNDWCSSKNRDLKTQRRHGEDHMKTEAEVGAMFPQAKNPNDCQ